MGFIKKFKNFINEDFETPEAEEECKHPLESSRPQGSSRPLPPPPPPSRPGSQTPSPKSKSANDLAQKPNYELIYTAINSNKIIKSVADQRPTSSNENPRLPKLDSDDHELPRPPSSLIGTVLSEYERLGEMPSPPPLSDFGDDSLSN